MLEGFDHIVLVEAGRGGDRPDGEGVAEHGARSQDPPRQVVEVREAVADDLLYPLGDDDVAERVLRRRGPARQAEVVEVVQELFDEEGVALGVTEERTGQRRGVEVVALPVGHEAHDRRFLQPLERHAVHRSLAVEVGEDAAPRHVKGGVPLAEGADEHQPGIAHRSGQVTEQQKRRPIRPNLLRNRRCKPQACSSPRRPPASVWQGVDGRPRKSAGTLIG